MTAPVLFDRSNGEFGLSFVMEDGQTFKVLAPGLARALGFRDAARMLETIPDEEKGYTLAGTPGGEQRVGYVTEPGFYRALGQRQAARIADALIREAVQRFQSWVYGTVLPSLRAGKTAAAELTRVDLARMILEEAERADVAEARNRELEPKAEYVDMFVSPDDLTTIRSAASRLDVGEHELRALLVEKHWIYRVLIGKRWSTRERRLVEEWEYRAYAEHRAHFRLIPQHNAPRHHNNQVRQTLYVTPTGLTAIARVAMRVGAS